MVWSRVFLLGFLLSRLVLLYCLTYKLIKVCFNYEARDALNLIVVQIVTGAHYFIPKKSILALAIVGSQDVLTDSIFITAVCSFSTLVYILNNKKKVICMSSLALLQMFAITLWLLFLESLTLIIQLNFLLVIVHSRSL